MATGSFHFLLWAHSDQAGGTEIPCLILKSLQLFFGRQLTIGIATPFPKQVDLFFSEELWRPDAENIILTPPFLALRAAGGIVNAAATYDNLLAPPFTNLDSVIKRLCQTLKPRVTAQTIVISCGEPVALKVAAVLGLKALIVTDHLLTCTVRWVLEHGGLFDKSMAGLLTTFEHYDRLAMEAFLSPLEFASQEYEAYLSHGSIRCMSIGGLFYEPAPAAVYRLLPSYSDLRNKAGDLPIVFVFGGGGSVWLHLYDRLRRQVDLGVIGGEFALLLPDVVPGENGGPERKMDTDGTPMYKLYLPTGSSEDLRDPGKLMNWYAACTLVVARGGLAAQQVLALMMSDLLDTPRMLFVEEPGHPQIEHERISLSNLGFVYSRTHGDFMGDPLDIIKEVLGDALRANSAGGHPRQRVRIRYGKAMMNELARYLIETHLPPMRP